MWNLKNKTALVTGGTKGIGKATVLEFLNLGAKVVFTARNKEQVAQMEEKLRSENFEVKGIAADVCNKNDQQKVVNWISENWKKLDVVVHNAGINIRKKITDYTKEEYQEIIDINLLAPFQLSQKLYPLLKNSGKASIINIGSAAATQDVGTGLPYAMAKAGLLQQTRSLAVEWAKDGIRANTVSPWFTETPLTEGYLAQPEKMKPILNATPLKRVAKAEEMAAIIAFLAMDKSSYITGQNIAADGGMSAKAI